MRTKDDLLKELEAHGIDPTKKVRKSRSDTGMPRDSYKQRSDKGKVRGSYTDTAAKHKAVYERMLKAQATGAGDGADNLTRDNNDIFPPNLNKYYRMIKNKNREYYINVTKPAHIEQARWRWLMMEVAENPDQWRAQVAKWYFIKEDEIGLWMYSEWAWAYVHYIKGDENRHTDEPKILSYEDYVAGRYNGHPKFDPRGEIIWTSSDSE